ncbi:WD40-repeat-containing domain protein [Protomyces lactucae-debilis]|uniref:Autophagy-related protein 18 n=1 Tax=Protomyces lactucae-debilis TaxID=2754530 RepID=A0A1Y2FQZ9_PROLT|nr:WD40-repeat-containing domain protein [Protomyces lactucae-debilis]ORY85744.1 WD40-repeat-containing domain protein [Protomyces lactucae-debilis]
MNAAFAGNFNQDYTCVSVGTKEGYRLYNCEPFGKIYEHPGGRSIVEMLFCTSLVALVGLGDQPDLSPRRLQIVNTKRGSSICELTFPTAILAVKLNRKRLVAVLSQNLYVYDIANMKLLHTIETSPNPNAICALSSSSDACYIAYPSPTPMPSSGADGAPAHAPVANPAHVPVSGDVLIYDASSLQPVNVVEAHKSPLSCIALSSDGTKLATASDKGTIIRVFSVPGADKLFQFRRGSLPAKIYSLNFDLSSTFLACSSDSETVHVFKLSHDHARRDRQEAPSTARVPPKGAMSMIRKSSQGFGRTFADTFGAYLPNSVTEMWEPIRDFASLKLQNGGKVKSVVAISTAGPEPHVMVVSSAGSLLQYAIDLELGGECPLVKSSSLLAMTE